MNSTQNTINKTLLLILDGFGIAPDSKFNAVKNANMPFYRELLNNYPNAQLLAHGENVGLPPGNMGNSEVGHMTIGAGKIIYQDLLRISNAIKDGSFYKNQILIETIKAGANKTGRVHLMGLISDAGVHSNINHLIALLDLCVTLEVQNVYIHAYLDGRDTAPTSSIGFLHTLLSHKAFSQTGVNKTRAKIATVMGRYWAMDRDKRWDRIEKAYKVLTGNMKPYFKNADAERKDAVIDIVTNSHKNNETDEFVQPSLIVPDGAIKDGDSVVFFNFRSDRARQLTRILVEKDFKPFTIDKKPELSSFAGMRCYDENHPNAEAFPPDTIGVNFPKVVSNTGLKQFKIAETEKFAHVTFFFNGGLEKELPGEERLLIPSPRDVATYDLKPEMSANEVAKNLCEKINENKYDFILCNFANPDMVGHTGIYKAAVAALETIDNCLKKVITAAKKANYNVIITSDHGNSDEMMDKNGEPHTQHTLNPVPIVWITPKEPPKGAKIKNGGLKDIAPTICRIMNLKKSEEMTGKNLIDI